VEHGRVGGNGAQALRRAHERLVEQPLRPRLVERQRDAQAPERVAVSAQQREQRREIAALCGDHQVVVTPGFRPWP
jgi:hypothetical protein